MNNCVFTVKTDSTDVADISLKRSYNPATGQVTPADADIHYVLNKGDTGLYSYSILAHKPDYPAFDLGSWRLVEWIAQDGTNYLCERIYVDSLRNWQMPSVYDFNNSEATPIAEIVKLKTGVRAGKYDGKYEYTAAFWETPVWGHASNVNHIGTWVVLSSPEYFNGGPTHQDLNAAAGINHVLLNGLHYGDKDFVIKQGEQWSKIYGPYLLYTSSKQTADENWAEAKHRAEVEKAKWPYAWLTNTPEYPLANERGSISGKFIINDPAKPTVKGQNAWVGVTKISNPDNQWQQEGKNYHYWVKTDSAGNFTIRNVRPDSYSFFAYSDGAVGEYLQQNITVTAGAINNLGNVTWNIPRNNGNLLWEIGVLNRKANEFKLGNFNYAEGFVERKFRDTFPNPIEYNVAENNWAAKIPYAHTKYPVAAFAPADTWKWRINFLLPAGFSTTGNAMLTIAYASADHAQQWIYVNNENNLFASYFPDNSDGNAFIRQANYAKYSYKQILIPMNKFVEGKNTITLVMPSNSGWVSHLMYDYISLEAQASTSLPIQLLSFTAEPAPNNEVLLKWSTSAEQNNGPFEVSHSIDGINFKVIATIKGKGTTQQQQQYSLYDKHPEKGINYYRLMQYDFDGKATNYGTKTVIISTIERVNVQAYPNPSNGAVSLQLAGYKGQVITVTMLTADGKIIHQEAIKTNTNSTLYPVHLNHKPVTGQYILKVSGTDINENLKVQFR